MSGLKRDIPVPIAIPEAYKILLKRERMQNNSINLIQKRNVRKKQKS